MAARRYAEDPDDPPDEHGAGISLDQILSLKEKFDGADLEGGGVPRHAGVHGRVWLHNQ